MRGVKTTTIVLLLMCAMYFITYIDRVNVSTAASGFGPEFGLNRTEIGLVFSGFAWSYLIFQVLGGWIADKFGPRRTLLVCGVIWACSTLATGLVTGLATMLVARVALGFGEGATFPTATRAMSVWFPAEKRGFAQGITHACARIGNALTPPLVAAIMVTISWRASFFITGVVSLVWVVLWWTNFRDDPAEHPRITAAEMAELKAVEPSRVHPPTPWGPLIRRMWPVIIVYFCYGWTLWLFLSWIPQYFLHAYKLRLSDSAFFAAAVFLAGVVGDTLGGIATDALLRRSGRLRVARVWVVSGCMVAALLCLLPVMATTNLTVITLCLAGGFFFSEFTIGPMWAIPMDIAPEFSGTASGLMNTGSALAAIASPVVGGYIIDTTGDWNGPFIGSILLLLVGAVLAFRMRPEQGLGLPPSDGVLRPAVRAA